MSNVPMQLPKCSTHGIPMQHRPVSCQTREQLWCGVWFDCTDHRCTNSVLLESAALKAQLGA